jgi:hypothetical protein
LSQSSRDPRIHLVVRRELIIDQDHSYNASIVSVEARRGHHAVQQKRRIAILFR